MIVVQGCLLEGWVACQVTSATPSVQQPVNCYVEVLIAYILLKIKTFEAALVCKCTLTYVCMSLPLPGTGPVAVGLLLQEISEGMIVVRTTIRFWLLVHT